MTLKMRPSSVSISFLEGSMSEVQGASGISISKNLILSHGTLLRSKILHDKKLQNLISTLVPGKLTFLEPCQSDNLQVRIQFRLDSTKTEKKSAKNLMNSVEEVNGSVIGCWHCPLLSDTFDNLFFAWRFGVDSTKINETLLPIFLVVRLQNEVEMNECSLETVLEDLRQLIDIEIPNAILRRGTLVEIASTPFGNSVFIDSISQGIVSNVLGTNECVMLTDATAVPGCEGGPVYILQPNNQGRLICGMVIAPLSWCHSEWVDYTFVACLFPCLTRLLSMSHQQQHISKMTKQHVPLTDITGLLDDCVVLVRCGSEWGSGILLERGTILTCSHVINEAPSRRIRVVLRNTDSDRYASASFMWAKLVYRTPRDLPYDIAVLQVASADIEKSLKTMTIGNGTAARGETVISAGYPFFSSTSPTITRGNVSSVSSCMLQTTCCIQSGASGGPIVRPSTGELLGMVVCNVITSRTLYPRLNMAIPATVIRGPVNEFINTGRAEALEALTSYEDDVLQTWNFHLSSKI